MSTDQPSSTTINSLPDPHTHLDPSVPPQYLARFIAQTLQRKGFEGGEAGAIVEMERLLEHHIHHVFASAMGWAQHANRASANTMDVLQAHEEISLRPKKFKRETKRRRRPMKLAKIEESPEISHQDTLADLTDYIRDNDNDPAPDFRVPLPSLPPKWTYARPKDDQEPLIKEETGRVILQVTPASLDFVKSTVMERGDISPELGIVNYRRGLGGARGKRKWGLKGVGVA
ncbi:hypothetical protein BCR39DRAFT_544363 [Naematelia encephala]|uniref:Bromodomain associated domain-containing protein n=1 Tax=Naematelia encephala TaxID=71784 RepID=A0A1Y2ARY2_9TREE|nr:hypothetical protein BCR39DRAFT_544363 [Naematelia encephala]